jgi:hypothetical protein
MPQKRQKPIAPAFPFKRLRNYWFSTSYGPMTARNYENLHAMSTGFTTFFEILLQGRKWPPKASEPQAGALFIASGSGRRPNPAQSCRRTGDLAYVLSSTTEHT